MKPAGTLKDPPRVDATIIGKEGVNTSVVWTRDAIS
jgi:hypothetical protein